MIVYLCFLLKRVSTCSQARVMVKMIFSKKSKTWMFWLSKSLFLSISHFLCISICITRFSFVIGSLIFFRSYFASPNGFLISFQHSTPIWKMVLGLKIKNSRGNKIVCRKSPKNTTISCYYNRKMIKNNVFLGIL